MVARKPLLGPAPHHPELERLLAESKSRPVTDEELRQQRISFAYGNAPKGSRLTKESVARAANAIRITPV